MVSQTQDAAGECRFLSTPPAFSVVKDTFSKTLRRGVFTAQQISKALAVVNLEPFGGIFDSAREFRGTGEGGLGFLICVALRPQQRLAIAGLQLQPSVGQPVGCRRAWARRRLRSPVGHLDGPAEMGDSLLKGRAS